MSTILTIVIANYNYGRFLGEAIRSVIADAEGVENRRLIIAGQKVELIICDAGSSDESLEVIKGFEKFIFRWCSEKDGGQSAAFNKGFEWGTGKYLTWLNADDVYYRGALKKVVTELARHPDCDWFTGNFFRFTHDGRVIEIGWGPNYYPKFLQRKCSPVVAFGPSTFFSREIYTRVGKIDESLHLIMDTDLWSRLVMQGVIQRRLRFICWGFRMHEESKTAEFDNHGLDEKARMRLQREEESVLNKTGYSPSRFMHTLRRVWRVLDLSCLVRCYLNVAFRHYKQ